MNFINAPTKKLAHVLDDFVSQTHSLKFNQDVLGALTSFKKKLTQAPALIDYIEQVCEERNKKGIGVKQLQFLMMAIIYRSSSTYATIPDLIANLNLISEYEWASVVNKNLIDEVGNGNNKPHPILLFNSFKIVGETFCFPFLTPSSYYLSCQLFQRKPILTVGPNPTFKEFTDQLMDYSLHIPGCEAQDFETAKYYWRLGGEELIAYHTYVLTNLLKKGEKKAEHGLEPANRVWLAVQALELATREASSVDEHDTGKLSYIGAYEKVIKTLLGHIPEERKDEVLAWSKAHNNVEMGQSLGWKASAEQGHADDARDLAMYLLSRLPPPAFAEALRAVTALCEMRLKYWDYVVAQLQTLGKEEQIFIPFI